MSGQSFICTIGVSASLCRAVVGAAIGRLSPGVLFSLMPLSPRYFRRYGKEITAFRFTYL